MQRRLGKLWPAAVVTALALALALAGGGCGGGGDSGTDGSTTTGGSTLTPKGAYTTALSQCQRIGAAALRANYQRKPSGGAGNAGDQKPLGIGLLAQVYVSQTTYFHPYEQQAIRGCEAGLRR